MVRIDVCAHFLRWGAFCQWRNSHHCMHIDTTNSQRASEGKGTQFWTGNSSSSTSYTYTSITTRQKKSITTTMANGKEKTKPILTFIKWFVAAQSSYTHLDERKNFFLIKCLQYTRIRPIKVSNHIKNLLIITKLKIKLNNAHHITFTFVPSNKQRKRWNLFSL